MAPAKYLVLSLKLHRQHHPFLHHLAGMEQGETVGAGVLQYLGPTLGGLYCTVGWMGCVSVIIASWEGTMVSVCSPPPTCSLQEWGAA